MYKILYSTQKGGGGYLKTVEDDFSREEAKREENEEKGKWEAKIGYFVENIFSSFSVLWNTP